MSDLQHLVEINLRVTAESDAVATEVAEILARVAVSLSAHPVMVTTDVERFVQHCGHPEHDHEVSS